MTQPQSTQSTANGGSSEPTYADFEHLRTYEAAKGFNKWIIVFQPDVPREEVQRHAKYIDDTEGKVLIMYKDIHGFLAWMDVDHVGVFMRNYREDVKYIEPDDTYGEIPLEFTEPARPFEKQSGGWYPYSD